MTNSLKRPTRRQAMATLGAVGAAGAAALLTGCGGGGSDSGSSATTYPGGQGVMAPGSATLTVTHQVTLTTNFGTIVVGLDGTHSPVSVANFLAYVAAGTYTNSLFHRVVPSSAAQGFAVAQGGGYADVSGVYTPLTTTAAIALESQNGLSNTQYTIGMARTSVANSATSQFYFNLVNNAAAFDYASSDNPGYAVFGTVSLTDTASIATLTAIAAVATGANAQASDTAYWPNTDVVITSAVKNS